MFQRILPRKQQQQKNPTEWEKIFTNLVVYVKEHLQFNNKKTNNLIKKQAKELNNCFFTENI